MRSILFPAALILAVASGSFAFASTTTEGTIKAIDMKTNQITLSDGTIYMLPAGFKDATLKVGEKVSIAWDLKGKVNEATAVTVVK